MSETTMAMSEMEAQIVITSRELIKPSSPTPHNIKEHKLSFLDQLAPTSFVPLLFLYPKNRRADSNVVDPKQITSHLKQSLSEILTKFYPLAGKLNPNLSVDCDDSGALFVEAKVGAPLSELQNAPLEKLKNYLPFEPWVRGSDDEKLLGTYPRNEILLAVQISWFECGGNAIGVCLSHKLGDAMSLVTFMSSWAATSRGSKSGEPNFDSGRRLFPPTESPFSFPPRSKKVKAVSKRFVFTKEKLRQLKELAASSSPVKDPTRVEVVTAFLWKQFISVSTARAKNQTCKAVVFRSRHVLNLRSRMRSLAALSNEEFPFGNLTYALVISASFTPEDIDYGNLVWQTRTAIRKLNEDDIKDSLVPYLKSPGGSTPAREEAVEQPTSTMVISDWFFSSFSRFPTYEVDFGWGKPVSVCPAGTPTGNGVILTNKSSSEDEIEAWISMAEDEMASLPNELLSLARSKFSYNRSRI